MSRNHFILVIEIMIISSMILSACTPRDFSRVPRVEGKGGYLDQIIFSTVSANQAVTQLQAGTIDAYFEGLASSDLTIIQAAGLNYASFNGLNYSLLFNPAQCSDGTLNPFNDRKVREAMNHILDRNYINQEIFAGGSLPKWLPIVSQMPDYADLIDVARALEAKYAYSLDKGMQIINAEMISLGASIDQAGKWQYKNAPVKLIILVRNDGDGTRVPIGDYAARQLEQAGFSVETLYRNSAEAAPLWIGSEPAACLWNIYTAGWVAGSLSRDERTTFQEMYLPNSLQEISAWMANEPDPEFQQVGDDLFNGNFATLQERHDLMARALELSLQDSLQVWLIDSKTFAPYAHNVQVTGDLASGIENSQIWPFTARFTERQGGSLRAGVSDLFTEPWNAIAGSNWPWDQAVMQATRSGSFIPDPFTGLQWPVKAEKASVIAQTGLPIGKSLDWVTLDFADSITVPPDAFVDWDATNQIFITAGTKFPQGLTAKIKSTLYYPSDLYKTTTWHDGSALAAADFIMPMIMAFDRANPNSAIYDESAVPVLQYFMTMFKGFRIIDTTPFTVEVYGDGFYQDAELDIFSVWPFYNFGEAPWDVIAISNQAEADGKLAYSADKAADRAIEQTNWVGGPTLEIFASYLDKAIANKTIPYAPTLGKYITANQATARYTNLKNWYTNHHHFIIGTGPYYIDQVYVAEKTITLNNYSGYSNPSDQFARFGEPMLADVAVTGPVSVTIGGNADFNITVTFNETPYPTAEIKSVSYLVFDATNTVIASGAADLISDGSYKATIDTSEFAAGSNKFEAIVVPISVAVPTFFDANFITTR